MEDESRPPVAYEYQATQPPAAGKRVPKSLRRDNCVYLMYDYREGCDSL